jgi:hypothetical protein
VTDNLFLFAWVLGVYILGGYFIICGSNFPHSPAADEEVFPTGLPRNTLLDRVVHGKAGLK